MKKKARTIAIILQFATASMLFAGCDEQARDFATKTKTILNQRSEQLAKKISAEKMAYESSASHAATDHRALADSSLQNERNERADALAADYAEGRKPVSLWRKDLSEYAHIDYETNRELLIADMDASTRYLQNFENLQIEQAKVDALSKLLATLAQKPSLKDDLGALTSFASDTQQELDKKICTQLKSQEKGDPAKDVAAIAYKDKNCDGVLKTK